MCPTAAAIPKSSKSGTFTMSQMVMQLNQANDELADKNEEIIKLKAYISQIIQQLEEKAPLLIKQREDYDTALDNINELTSQNDALILEIQQLREDSAECRRSEGKYV